MSSNLVPGWTWSLTILTLILSYQVASTICRALPSTPSQLSETVGIKCLGQEYSNLPLHWNDCAGALYQLRNDPNYISRKRYWELPTPGVYSKWKSPGDKCEIKLGTGIGNREGYFRLPEIDDALVEVEKQCPEFGGWLYLQTFVSRMEKGWWVKVYRSRQLSNEEDLVEENMPHVGIA